MAINRINFPKGEGNCKKTLVSLPNQQVISGIELTAATIRKRILNRDMNRLLP